MQIMLKTGCLAICLSGIIIFSAKAGLNEAIGLQHPYDRTVVHCSANSKYSAEDCAQYFETRGFVRFRDIPYKTAGYDFLKVDTYPTRRWRGSELTPRW
ncbi:MAG: hypothetical protein E7012_00785 [Alphaproteobacteria bacterium]|nr:hypothetical protein [Alphaproteobacteria bacterium]